MATPTYELIETTTLASSASSVSFSSITQDYRDLVLVANVTSSATISGALLVFNDDDANGETVDMTGNGTSATSQTYSAPIRLTGGNIFIEPGPALFKIDIMDYSATDKHTSVLIRGNSLGGGQDGTTARAGRWPNTSAVTTVEFRGDANGFAAGSTLSLYGIAS